MDDKTLQHKLNQLVKLANEIVTEGESRYGRKAQLFYEAEGTFHLMSDDVDGSSYDRTCFVKFSSEGMCRMDCGAW